jgi:hypothetical protein
MVLKDVFSFSSFDILFSINIIPSFTIDSIHRMYTKYLNKFGFWRSNTWLTLIVLIIEILIVSQINSLLFESLVSLLTSDAKTLMQTILYAMFHALTICIVV